jgi:hypothetical protein
VSEKLWKITSIEMTEDARRFGVDRVVYAYHVQGEYLPACGKSGTFAWTIPARDLESSQYDLSQVELPATTREGEGEK